MTAFYSATAAARILGISRQRFQRLADRLGVGRTIEPRGRVYTLDDIETVRRGRQPRPGRPRKHT